jgi:hypothetical protein
MEWYAGNKPEGATHLADGRAAEVKTGRHFQYLEKNMDKKTQRLAMAAIAGIGIGLASPAPVLAQDKSTDTVKCYGINSCHAQAKCSVKGDDLAAVRTFLGDAEYNTRFGKSKAHSCGAHAKCGSNRQILNWTPVSAPACEAQGGILIDKVDGKKVAKKA